MFSPSGSRFPGDAPSVSAAELRRNFGEWQERALQTPVVVVKHGKPRLVLSSTEEFLGSHRESSSASAAEQALVSALASIPEHSSEAFFVLDRDLTLLAVNHVYEDLIACPAHTMVGRNWAQLFPADNDSILGAKIRQTLRSGEAAHFEAPSTLAPGRYYLITVYPHASGVAVLLVNKTAEAVMRQELEEFRSLAASFATIPDWAILKLNLRGYLFGGSPQFKAITGFDADNAPSPRFVDLVDERDRAAVAASIESVLGGGRAQRLNATLVTKHGNDLKVDLALAPLWRGSAVDGAMMALNVRPQQPDRELQL